MAMTITDQVSKLQKQEPYRRKEDPSFSEILREIDELKAEGIIGTKGYSLPMLDTLGRYLIRTRFRESS